jgi:hypothetical protein
MLKHRWGVWLGIGLLLPALAWTALCLGVYAYGSRHLPADMTPPARRAPAAAQALFLRLNAPDAQSLPELSPLTLPFVIFGRKDLHGKTRADQELRLLSLAARTTEPTLLRSNTARLSAHAAAMIRIGREWSRDDAVNAVLLRSEYGRDAIGIEAAAQAYFGVDAQALRPQEILALLILARGPSWFSVDCRRARFDTVFARDAARVGERGAAWQADAALRRLRVRPYTRGVPTTPSAPHASAG